MKDFVKALVLNRASVFTLPLAMLVIPLCYAQQPEPPAAAAPPVAAAPASAAAAPAPVAAAVAAPATAAVAAPATVAVAAPGTVRLSEGSDVALAFDEDLSSKTSEEGDPVTFVLTDDLKVGDVVVAKAGAKAFGEVSHAEKSGMMGKPGDLSIRLDYLKAGEVKVHLRGTKAKEGANGTTATVALTVLFGPIGLIKHGKNIDIKKGTTLKAYVADDYTLPPAI
jgi:hypothetical protein